ncbi:unnamed protein product [Orchesella dallaii]|uniref:Uncharacterized protein n=1 Tax=Orchesella dallaii TaxID=48710 RepID=A0ABP1Q7U4_9HEXA
MGKDFFPITDASSTIQSNQQTTGSVTGFANSTAQGNGTPNSAVAYAWQGGQTSAQGAQSATAENGVFQANTTGSSTCLQGYIGNAGNANSTQADSSGNATCITTYSEDGTQNTASERKIRRNFCTFVN